MEKTLPIVENLEIIDAGAEGQGVGKHENMVFFVDHSVPGDIVDVTIFRKRKNFREARITNLKKASPNRVDPVCSHFGVCGGCKWQHMNYAQQLKFKQKQVSDSLQRIGKMELPEIQTIIPSANEYYYRNKLEFTFSNKRWLTVAEIGRADNYNEDDRKALGFHIPGFFDKVLNIEKCHLQDDLSNQIRNAVKSYGLEHKLDFFDLKQQHGLLRNLLIRSTSTGEWMVIVVFFKEEQEKREGLLNYLSEKFPQITSLMYIINTKKNDSISDQEVLPYKGKDHIVEQMPAFSGNGKLSFKIGPKSFYQTNSLQAYQLYKVAAEFAAIQPNELVYDLYTGTGTIANFIASQAKKVVGVEYVEPAIVDARYNSQLNGITNTVFYSGDMKDVLSNDFVSINGKPDVIITDPPRAGMDEKVVRKLLEIEAGRIVYVSCNPSTQARDLALLSEKYIVEKIQPVDMFPQTHHVENVVLLTFR